MAGSLRLRHGFEEAGAGEVVLPTGEPEVRHLHGCERDAAVGGAEDSVAGRVREQERQRDEYRRKVEEHVGHVDPGEARDERIDGVPEREGVARVEAAVLELVHAREAAQHVELRELPGPGEVKETVAVDGSRSPPDDRREEHAGGEDGGKRAPFHGLDRSHAVPKNRGHCDDHAHRADHDPHQQDRPPRGEDEREPEGVDGEAERERARERDPRRGRPADRAQEKRARDEEHARCRRGEANREPWAGRRQEVGEEEKRRRERDEADEPSARPDRERGRQGSYPAASSLH